MSEHENGGAPAPKRLIIADPLLPDGIEVLAATPGIEVEDHTGDDRETLKQALVGASAIIVRSRTKVDQELIEATDSLEVIGRAGVGVDNIDIEAATRRGIAVLNAPAANTYSTAELAFALLLAAARRVPEADASMRAGEWRRKELRGTQLKGKTIGIVGLGRIGTEVAQRAAAFGMSVVGFDPFVDNARARERGIEPLSLEALLERSDVVSLHIPMTPENRGLIGRDQMASMPEGAILVNAARGGLVDEDALAEALSSGHLAAAGLDVYANEPLPEDSPLRQLPNIVMTPHLGASTVEAQREVSRQIAVAVRDALMRDDFQGALNAPYEAGGNEWTGPIMDLGRCLGALIGQLDEVPPTRIEIRYSGAVDGVLDPLTAAAIVGFLKQQVEPPLNVVNAVAIANDRGLEIAHVRVDEDSDYTNYVELCATSSAGEEMIVGGTVLGDRHEPRVVRIGNFHINTVPRGTCLVIRNRDLPGVIGAVGTALGEAGANIAEYHLARREAGGRSLGMVRVDGALPRAVLDGLEAIEAVDKVQQVHFD